MTETTTTQRSIDAVRADALRNAASALRDVSKDSPYAGLLEQATDVWSYDSGEVDAAYATWLEALAQHLDGSAKEPDPAPMSVPIDNLQGLLLEQLAQHQRTRPFDPDNLGSPPEYEVARMNEWQRKNDALRLLIGARFTQAALDQRKTGGVTT